VSCCFSARSFFGVFSCRPRASLSTLHKRGHFGVVQRWMCNDVCVCVCVCVHVGEHNAEITVYVCVCEQMCSLVANQSHSYRSRNRDLKHLKKRGVCVCVWKSSMLLLLLLLPSIVTPLFHPSYVTIFSCRARGSLYCDLCDDMLNRYHMVHL